MTLVGQLGILFVVAYFCHYVFHVSRSMRIRAAFLRGLSPDKRNLGLLHLWRDGVAHVAVQLVVPFPSKCFRHNSVSDNAWGVGREKYA